MPSRTVPEGPLPADDQPVQLSDEDWLWAQETWVVDEPEDGTLYSLPDPDAGGDEEPGPLPARRPSG